MSKPVKSVSYVQDDGSETFAIVRSKNKNGSLNLIVLDPDTYQWRAANDVPADRCK